MRPAEDSAGDLGHQHDGVGGNGLRKTIKNRGPFPSDRAAVGLQVAACMFCGIR
jgi:hypothetical protein